MAETLPSLCLRVEEWHTEWGPETNWSYRFNEALSQSREQGRAAVDKFFTDCERHAREGRQLIQSLCSTARWGILGHKERVRDACHGSTGSPSALSEEDSKGGVTVLEGSKVLARGTRSCT